MSKLVQKAATALEQAYNELLEYLPYEAKLNVDETGHKENGDRFWTWCFRGDAYTLFKIADTRGSRVLTEVLGEDFAGVIGCDYFSAYRKYMKDCHVLVQSCIAHLIRELKYLAGLTDLDSHKSYIRQLSCEGLCFCVVFAFPELTALSSLFRDRINCF